MRVLVTRPQGQAAEWVERLRALGVDATAVPLLGIDAPVDAQAVRRAWADLARHRAVMFVSPNAVERFFAAAPQTHQPVWPADVLAAGTGPGTRAALARAGVPADQVLCPPPESERFDSEALWPLLRARGPWAGQSLLVVRGEGGRDWLAEQLRQDGAHVHFVEAYRRSAPLLDAKAQSALSAALARPAAHVWLFSSSEAMRYLPGLAPGARWSSAQALATHPRIAQAAQALGFGRVDAVPPTPEAVQAWVTRSIQSPGS